VESVYCAVGAESLCIIQVSSSLKSVSTCEMYVVYSEFDTSGVTCVTGWTIK